MTPHGPVTSSTPRHGAILGVVTYADAPHVSLTEAAAMTGLSVSTLRRRREALRAHGAFQKEDGSWMIPVPALVDLGMLDRVTPDDPAPQTAAPDEVADLRVEVERERGLRIAAEREVQAITAHLATAQHTIRMIEAAPPKVETRVERVEVPVEVPKVETRVERVEVPVEVEVPVPVVPSWMWWLLSALMVALATLVLAWTLAPRTHAAAPDQSPSAPPPAAVVPSLLSPSATSTPSPALSTSVPVVIDPPTG